MYIFVYFCPECRLNQVEQVLTPIQFVTSSSLTEIMNSMTWYGGTTAIADGLAMAADTLDLNDLVRDAMLVITDGFDGDLEALQVSSAALAIDDVTTLGIAYDEVPGLLMSTLEEIAHGDLSRVHTAESNMELKSLTSDIFRVLCAISTQTETNPVQVREIRKRKVYESASEYKNKFNQIPNWLPNYKQWKKKQLPFFTFEKFD